MRLPASIHVGAVDDERNNRWMPCSNSADRVDPGDVAVVLIGEVRSIIQFGGSFRRCHQDSPEWKDERRMLPEVLWKPLEELEAAEQDVSWLGNEYAQSLRGITYNQRGDRVHAARQVSTQAADAALREVQEELHAAFQAAKAKAQAAKAAVEARSEERSHAMSELDRNIVSAWMQQHAPVLHQLYADFSRWFQDNRRQLDGLGVDRRQSFGERTRNSSCEIVGEIAGSLVSLLQSAECPSKNAFDDLDLPWDEWEGLHRAVRNEVGLVAAHTTQHVSAAATPPFNERTSPRHVILSGSARSTPIIQQIRARLHRHVIGLAGNISNLMNLVQRYPDGVGLTMMRQHIAYSSAPDPEPATPERAQQWQCTIGLIRTELAKASQLWDQDTAGENTRLHLDFDRLGHEATCSALYSLTYHGLMILVARIILDPTAVPPYALAEVADASDNVATLQSVVQKRVVQALMSRPWWRKFDIESAREYAQVLALPPLGHFDPLPSSVPEPGAVPDGTGGEGSSALRVHGRPEEHDNRHVNAEVVGTPDPSRRAVEGGKNQSRARSRPSPEAIDRTACGILKDALQAAHDAGENYVPARTDIAGAVSKALNLPITVETLFGTKQAAEGRVHRYPEFMGSWKALQAAGKAARKQFAQKRSTSKQHKA